MPSPTAYEEIAKVASDRVVVVDGDGSVEEVHAAGDGGGASARGLMRFDGLWCPL